MLTSSRRGIVYPNPNRSDTADVPRDFLATVNALEVDVVYGQGTLAARPTSSPGSPGIQGRIYQASDQTPKQFYWDNGQGWDAIGAVTPGVINQIGLLTNRPVASSVLTGTKYFATDQWVEYLSDSTQWLRMGLPAGAEVEWFSAAVPTGWIRYDGGNMPSSTGIYADLYAHLGSVLTTPDTKGRVTVGVGGHSDHTTVLGNDGNATGNRRIRHRHTVARSADVGLGQNPHNHGGQTAGPNVTLLENDQLGGGTVAGGGVGIWEGRALHVHSIPSDNAGVYISQQPMFTVGPQSGAEPVDSPAYINGYKIAKL